MLQFIDGFSCAVNDNKSAFTIKFTQHEPVVPTPENGEESVRVITHDISSVIMTYDSAKQLLRSLTELISIAESEESK